MLSYKVYFRGFGLWKSLPKLIKCRHGRSMSIGTFGCKIGVIFTFKTLVSDWLFLNNNNPFLLEIIIVLLLGIWWGKWKQSLAKDHVDPVPALLLPLKMRQCCKEALVLLKYTHGYTTDEPLRNKNMHKKS